MTVPPLEDFRAEVRTWLQAELGGDFADVRGTGGPGREHEAIERRREWERHLGAAGWIGLGWSESAGGRGLPLAHQVVFHEEYARAGGPGRLLHISEQLLAPTLLALGTPKQQDEHLPGILHGEVLWCQGYSEPGAGSDLAGVATRAVREGDEYVITGQKVWTSQAHLAEWAFVLVRTEPGSARHAGLSFLLVPMDQPGIEVRPIVQITGTSEFNEVFFDGARTSVANRVGAEGEGWKVAMALLGFERGVSTLGQQIGFEREYAAVLAAARRGGVWVEGWARDAGLADRLERSWTRFLAVRAVAEGTLRSSGTEASGLEASISKLLWATWHRDLGELAVDVAGLDGLVEPEVPSEGDSGLTEAQTLWLFTRSDTIYGGSNEVQRNILAERLLGMPREGSEGATTPKAHAVQWDPGDQLLTTDAAGEIRDGLRSVLRERVPRPSRAFDPALQKVLLDDLGVGMLAVPESLGGLGLGWVEAAVVARELGVHLASTALLDTLVASGWLAESEGAGDLLERYATEQPLVVVAGLNGGLGVSDGHGGPRLNGTTRAVPWATRADWLLVLAADAVWLVEKGAHGLTVTERTAVDPTRELADVHLDEVDAMRVPGNGELLVARWRTLAAAEASGTAYRALSETVRYLGERRQFGRVLASYQALKHRCADLVVEVAAATALAAQAISRTEVAAAAKVVASDALTAVAADALQLHGGVGFTDEYDVHLWLKRGKAHQSLGGTNAALRSEALALAPVAE